mmetsp:Transcript_3921/g.4557  ORF Transcript_3921/g.4557 Transcript_3921/m.4557 type:complete len:80 (-) Transcript_3921:1036-1275(-)
MTEPKTLVTKHMRLPNLSRNIAAAKLPGIFAEAKKNAPKYTSVIPLTCANIVFIHVQIPDPKLKVNHKICNGIVFRRRP